MIAWLPSPQPASSNPLSLKFLPWKPQSKAASNTGISYTVPVGANRHPVRQFLKQTLSWSRVRLLYARVTLTRFTTAYFFLASCALFTLAVLHALTFSDNVTAIKVLEGVIASQSGNFIYTPSQTLNGSATPATQLLVVDATHQRLVVIQNNVLSVCDSLPGQPGTTCAGILVFTGGKARKQKKQKKGIYQYRRDHDNDDDDNLNGVEDDDDGEGDDDDDKVATVTTLSSPTSTFSPRASTLSSSVNTPFPRPLSTQAAATTTLFSAPQSSPSSSRPPQQEDDSDGIDNVVTQSSFSETKLATTTKTATVTSVVPSTPTSTTLKDTRPAAAAAAAPLILEETCVLSLEWLNETLHDAQREDVVTFLFEVWLFALALVTILTESIPHLVTGLLGHALGAGWAAYRLANTKSLERFYKNHIMPEACANHDPMGEWWTVKIHHAIPLVVVNVVTLLGIMYLSFMLFKVYARETFSRVGASPVIHRVYKIVLVFSVFLQLSGFFSLASSAMWIDKMCHGTLMLVARHSTLYRVLFIVGFLLEIPWLVLGWTCVRKECRIRFGIFCAISVILWVIPTVMFTRPLYLFIISSWPFFTAVTVTAYVVIVVTAILGILCRLNFDKGLKHYLEVTDALEGVDFTPVVFTKYGDEKDPENFAFNNSGPRRRGSTSGLKTLHLQVPERSGTGLLPNGNEQDTNKLSTRRGHSVYSDKDSSPIILSASPPLVSDLGPAPRRKSLLAMVRNIRRSIVPAYPPVSIAGAATYNSSAARESIDTTSSHSTSKESVSTSPTRPDQAAVVLGRSKQRLLSERSVSGRPSLPANPRMGLKRF